MVNAFGKKYYLLQKTTIKIYNVNKLTKPEKQIQEEELPSLGLIDRNTFTNKKMSKIYMNYPKHPFQG